MFGCLDRLWIFAALFQQFKDVYNCGLSVSYIFLSMIFMLCGLRIFYVYICGLMIVMTVLHPVVSITTDSR